METLHSIANSFDHIRTATKHKQSTEQLYILKMNITMLSRKLMVFGKQDHDQFVRSLAMDGYLGLLSTNTMPLSLQEKRNLLQTAFDKLKNYALRDECLFVMLRIQNLLCYCLIQLDQTTLARDILESMEELYVNVSESLPDRFLDAEDLFTPEPLSAIKSVNPEKIDKVITNNIQMQAFLYNKLNLPDKYMLYNYTALRRQLEMKDGTPQDWVLRAARLGNYFTHQHQMANARRHLCAAYSVLRTCKDSHKIRSGYLSQKADLETHFLELSHHWVKYGLTLFKLSKKAVLNQYFTASLTRPDTRKTVDPDAMWEIPDDESVVVGLGREAKSGEAGGNTNPEKVFAFPSLNLRDIEERVPLAKVTEVESARKLFAFTHKWLLRSKNIYNFEQTPAQFISCSLQLAELYEYLAFFEPDVDHQYIIQKRRAGVLETLNCLLKTCSNVTSIQIDVIRELSQVQLELMALNLQKLYREESQTNIFDMNTDSQLMMHSLNSHSDGTLTGGFGKANTQSMYQRKMEAAISLSSQLFRFSGQIGAMTPSQFDLAHLKDSPEPSTMKVPFNDGSIFT